MTKHPLHCSDKITIKLKKEEEILEPISPLS